MVSVAMLDPYDPVRTQMNTLLSIVCKCTFPIRADGFEFTSGNLAERVLHVLIKRGTIIGVLNSFPPCCGALAVLQTLCYREKISKHVTLKTRDEEESCKLLTEWIRDMDV